MCTSLSARTWMTSTQALGMASLEVAFMRANILGMWPSGGTWTAWTQTEKSTLSLIIYCTCTWSAREGCAVNRHTHAVVTVSNTSPYVRVRVCVCVYNWRHTTITVTKYLARVRGTLLVERNLHLFRQRHRRDSWDSCRPWSPFVGWTQPRIPPGQLQCLAQSQH